MGELHLEIIVDRMMREFGVAANVGKPQVAYRETIRQTAEYDYTHKKQTGGQRPVRAHQIARGTESQAWAIEFENDVMGGAIPKEFISGGRKGRRRKRSKAASWPAIRWST